MSEALRQRIIQLLKTSATLDETADLILAEMPDPRLSIGGNAPPDESENDEPLLANINPEALVIIDPSEFPALFDLHYPLLRDRAVEMKAACDKWQADHKTQAGGWLPIKDDAENGNLADFVKQVDGFMDEVEEARVAVKAKVREAGTAIDAYFRGGLSDPVADIRGVTRTVSNKRYAPGPGTMQFAQTKYLTDKAETERQAREAAAAAAAAEAQRKIDEARQLAEQEKQRIAELEADGADREEAREIAEAETNKAAAVADAAQASSSLIGSYATEPAGALVRQHTATGTTVGLSGRWVFEVTNMAELCLAVGAPALTGELFVNKVAATSMIGVGGCRAVLQAAVQILTHGGALPATFLATDDKNIRAAITARTAPLREAPGLRIYQEQSARRR